MRLNLALGAVELAAADDGPAPGRTLTGVVAPYGQYGSTSAGRYRIAEHALSWPDDLRRVKLFAGHDRERPIAHATLAAAGPSGVRMSFAVARTPDGDAALIEASEGIRDAFSVELDDVELDGDTITAGRIVGVALVPLPAYADARVTEVAAEHAAPPAGDDDDDEADAGEADDDESDDDAAGAGEHDDAPGDAGDDEGDDEMSGKAIAAARPAALTAARPARAAVAQRRAGGLSVRRVAEVLASWSANPHDPAIAAALADITYTSASATVSPPGWLGELWEGVRYQRVVIPLISAADLTNFRMTGWRWSTRPSGGPYAGDKAQIPSNPAVVEPVPLTAERWAGGNDIDRAYFDFNDAEFLDSYTREMADDYAQFTDDDALAELVAGAETQTAPDLTSALITGALAMNEVRVRPTSVLMSVDLLNQWAALTADATPPLLTALLGEPGIDSLLSLVHPDLPAQTLLMINRQSAEFRELPGSPLRFDALELARGGVDRAFFGYYKTWVRKPGGVQAVTVGATLP